MAIIPKYLFIRKRFICKTHVNYKAKSKTNEKKVSQRIKINYKIISLITKEHNREGKRRKGREREQL